MMLSIRLSRFIVVLLVSAFSLGLWVTVQAGEPDIPGGSPPEPTASPTPSPSDDRIAEYSLTIDYEGDIAAEWMRLLYDLVEDEGVSAPGGARLYAYAGVTLYQAVVPGMPNNFTLVGTLSGLEDIPQINYDLPYDWPSVAVGALSTLYNNLFDAPAPATRNAISDLRDRHIAQRKAVANDEMVDRSVQYGDELATSIVAWMNDDGYLFTRDRGYTIPTGDPSLWELTTPGTEPVEPYWGTLRPFGLYFAEACHQRLNLPFSTEPDSFFYRQAMEVKNAYDALSDEQREIARFWVDTPGVTGTPAGHWLMIGIQLVELLDLDLQRAAEMFALLNMALGDAFISAWSLKYEVNLLRPVTYINRYIDPAWRPYVETPPFPEYPSGHSMVSGAASEVLTTMFGPIAFTDRTHVLTGHEPLVREFMSFEQAAYEAAFSRLYGGIHYRAGIENGLRQGRCVGQAVLNNVPLRSLPQGGE